MLHIERFQVNMLQEKSKKINGKTKKERNSPLLFLGIYNNEKRIGDARFGTPAYRIETTVKTEI